MPGTIACLFELIELIDLMHSVADPGFPRPGRQPLGLARKPIVFGENCRKIKELGPREGAHIPSAHSLDIRQWQYIQSYFAQWSKVLDSSFSGKR